MPSSLVRLGQRGWEPPQSKSTSASSYENGLDLTGKVFKAPWSILIWECGIYILSGSIYHRVLAKYIQQYAFTAGTTQCLIGIAWRRRSCGVTLHLGTSSPSWNMKPSLVSFTLNLPKPRPLNEDSSQVRHELKGVIKLSQIGRSWLVSEPPPEAIFSENLRVWQIWQIPAGSWWLPLLLINPSSLMFGQPNAS